MPALTDAQKNILRFLNASPAPLTPGFYKGVQCAEARPGTDRRVWLPNRVYDTIIARNLTTFLGPNDTRRIPNRANPQVARFLEAPR